VVGADNKQPLTRRFGAYEIIRPLARGGMAELFLVRAKGPEGFEKTFVLKRILPHLAENPRLTRAFLDEAKLVATFDHPHIAHVHDMGTAEGSYFFTMDFVHGVDLRALLKRYRRERTPMPLALAVLIARNIASALHYAHERRGPDGKHLGVVHRDVSPSNIIVSYDGVPKLVDFGIAKAATSSTKTQTGMLKGKIAYMSPEQAKGLPLDRRTDVYALGIILWEMIAGRRLYKCENDMATIQRIINAPAESPRPHRPDCPRGLEQIVMRALALDIDARYQTAAQLEHDLEELALAQRYKQSATVLGAELAQRYADELALWEEAQAGTVTVTDGIAARTSDHYFAALGFPLAYDDDDDDDDALDVDESMATPQRRVDVPPATTATFSGEAVVAAPSPRARRLPWIAAAVGGLSISAGIALAVAFSGSDVGVPSARPAAVPAPAPAPIPAPVQAAPAPSTPPPVVDDIEMPADPPPVVDDIEMPAESRDVAAPPVKRKKPVRVAPKKPKRRTVDEPAKPPPPKPTKPPTKPWDPDDPFPPPS
jgi:tRNA A-37 threonylcarbamoyl transferase component Bud32